jgi:hypothetical protein
MSERRKRSDISDDEIIAVIRAQKDLPLLDRRFPEQVLADKYPPKVVLAKMQDMVDRGILEYGVSLHSSRVKEQ